MKAPTPSVAPLPPPAIKAQSEAPAPAKATAGPVVRRVKLPPAAPASNLAALRKQVAQRIVDTHPDETYTTKAPFNVLAAVSLLIELRPDGSVGSVQLLRRPSQAPETVDLAIDALRRAAPFGGVRGGRSSLTLTETFLFTHDGRFKPRSLE
jgi:hypothetical protein